MATHIGAEGVVRIGANTVGEVTAFSMSIDSEMIPVKKLGDIILDFGRALTGAGMGKTEFSTAGMRATQKGVYKPTSGQTAIRHNNLDAAAHEIAHRVDDFFPITAPGSGSPAPIWRRSCGASRVSPMASAA